jgi:hypothetical protein
VWTVSSWHKEKGFYEKDSEHLSLLKKLRVIIRDISKLKFEDFYTSSASNVTVALCTDYPPPPANKYSGFSSVGMHPASLSCNQPSTT